MKKILSICFLLILAPFAWASTLAITVDTAPAPGLPAPTILVRSIFGPVIQNTVNWGATWNLTIPAGNYTIQPLPVTVGTLFYIAPSQFVPVPPSTTVNRTVTYHVV